MVDILVNLVSGFTNFEVLLNFLYENGVTKILLDLSHFICAKILGIKFRNNSGFAIRNDKSRIMLDHATIIR